MRAAHANASSRAGIEGDHATEELGGECSLFLGWQSVEGLKQLARLTAHIPRIEPPLRKAKPDETR